METSFMRTVRAQRLDAYNRPRVLLNLRPEGAISLIEGAALIAWLPVVRVGDVVKDRGPPKAAALRAVLDNIANTNRVLSMRSKPLSGPMRRHL
jgi:hypothetical protein